MTVSTRVCLQVSSGATVHEDYAFLGNQVDISNNNNKFYRGQVVLDSGTAYCWTRWGRVGEPGQLKDPQIPL